MKLLLLSSVLVLGLAACSHRAHKHEGCGGCGGAKMEKQDCKDKECGLKKDGCGDCQSKAESK